jgi:hypothetical protein
MKLLNNMAVVRYSLLDIQTLAQKEGLSLEEFLIEYDEFLVEEDGFVYLNLK